MRYVRNFTVIYGTKFSQNIVLLPLRKIHYHQQNLLFWVRHKVFFDGKNTFSKHLLKMLCSLQLIWPWFSVYLTRKLRGYSTFGKHLLVFPVRISCIERMFPVELTTNVVFICLFSSAPLMGTFLIPFKLNILLPRRHVRKGCLIKVDNEIPLACHDHTQQLQWTFEWEIFLQLRAG